jgi:hypothetical protein
MHVNRLPVLKAVVLFSWWILPDPTECIFVRQELKVLQ